VCVSNIGILEKDADLIGIHTVGTTPVGGCGVFARPAIAFLNWRACRAFLYLLYVAPALSQSPPEPITPFGDETAVPFWWIACGLCTPCVIVLIRCLKDPLYSCNPLTMVLSLLMRTDVASSLLGDLLEKFNLELVKIGRWRAAWDFWKQLFLSLRPLASSTLKRLSGLETLIDFYQRLRS